MEFRNKRVLVVGSGKSGIGAARLLGKQMSRRYKGKRERYRDWRLWQEAFPKKSKGN